VADAIEFGAARRLWRQLLDEIDRQRMIVACHEPFAGFDEVLCLGCDGRTRWADCPKAAELAWAYRTWRPS
jgi:hypothetical protein